MDGKFNEEGYQNNSIHLKDKEKKENKIKQIMENSLLTLRKKKNIKKIISKIKDNNLIMYSIVEKNYLISNTDVEIPDTLNEYYNNLKNKQNFLYESINNEEGIISKFDIDKINLTKFILLQINYYIEFMLDNYETNIENIQNFFDNKTINSLIKILYEYTNKNNINNNIINENVNVNDIITNSEIIIYNICKILIKLTSLSNYYTSNIITNENNIELLYSSLSYYYKINQLLGNYLLLIIYNCYLDNEIEAITNYDKLTLFLLEKISNFYKSPIQNIIKSNFLLTIIEFLTILLNENTFNTFMNNQYINNCILLMANIIQKYDNEYIKYSSIKCLAHLLHCIDENNILNIDNFQNLIKSLLPYLNLEINETSIVIKTLEIISLFTYLFEIDKFVNNELIDEINQILIYYNIHKEQNKLLFLTDEHLNQKFNNIIENIAIILLNCCLSKQIYDFIILHTSILKNIILIIYNYSIDIPILINIYGFLNEFMDNEDNFMALIIANFLEVGIIQSLDKYLDTNAYDVIFIILNFAYKSLEYGNIFLEKNFGNKKYSKINFVQAFLDKKGFNDKLNLIASPDFGNIKCSDAAKKLQEIFFSLK